MVEVIRELSVTPSGATQILVKKGESYFIVSSVVSQRSGFETLVFKADRRGMITDHEPVAGGPGVTREDAIQELEESFP